MYLRFVVDDVDADSQKPLGVFQAIHNLRSKGELSDYERLQDDEIGRWFRCKPAEADPVHFIQTALS